MTAEFLTIMTAETSAKVFRIVPLFLAEALDALSAMASLAVRSRGACLRSPWQRQEMRERGILWFPIPDDIS